jgi:cysteine desulfurase
VLAIASMGVMAEEVGKIEAQGAEMKRLRDLFEARLLREISDVSITGGEALRLPNTSSLVIPGVDGETLLMNLDLKGYAVSTGAACSSGSPEPSPVLLAMGLARTEAQASMRIGLGWSTTEEQLNDFIDALKDVAARLREISGYRAAGQEKAPGGVL